MSADAFESPEWYRVAKASPGLRRDVEVRRHLYQNRPWYVLSDATSGKVHRLTPAAYEFVGRLDGRRPVDAIWREIVAEFGADSPTQGDIVKLLTQLHGADLLWGADRPLLDELLDRRDKDRRQVWKKLLMNPLSATVPLVDPNRFLLLVARAMSILPAAVWWLAGAAVILPAAFLAVVHWRALSQRGLDGLLDLENLVLLALIYPVVKALHEIGHGVAIRSRGGEVHEMGLMFIVFYPIPYVEASASLAFPSKWARAAVASAGVMVEMTIAAGALYVWLAVEPGAVSTVAYNTMLIAGFSTLLVNGNPLLRFDGYHVLCDVIEIPNLGKRGNEYWGEMLRVHLLGTREPDRLPTTRWERLWFVLYPPAAYVYRIFIALTIAMFVATTYRLAGMVLAAWSLALTVAWPAMKTAHKAFTDQRIRNAGPRAAWVALAGAGAAAALLFVVPAPHHIVTQGVVWLPSEAFVRSAASGRVESVGVGHGERIEPDRFLLRLDAPERQSALAVAVARHRRAEVAYEAARFDDRAAAVALLSELEDARRRLDDARRRVDELTLRSAIGGRIEIRDARDLEGRFVREGDVVANILPDARPVIRAVVRQADAELLRRGMRSVSVRFAHEIGTVLPARIAREVPGGDTLLPSPALTIDGGGEIAAIPRDDGELHAPERLFQFDLALENDAVATLPFGMRAFVRIELEPLPLAWQAGLRLRQLLLATFDV